MKALFTLLPVVFATVSAVASAQSLDEIRMKADMAMLAESSTEDKAKKPSEETEKEAKDDEENKKPQKTAPFRVISGSYFDLSVNQDFHIPMLSPRDLDWAHGYSTMIGASYGWCPYGICHGPVLQMGWLWVGGTDLNKSRNKNPDGAVFIGSAGYLISPYISKDWAFTTMLSIPFTAGGIGIQEDIGFSYVPDLITGFYMGVDFGLQLGYLQTGVEAANSKDVDWFSIGLYVNLNWEVWNNYQYVRVR